jgi:hypothetical protein
VEPIPPHSPFQVLEPLASLTRALLLGCAVVAGGSLVADVAQYVFVDDLIHDPTSVAAVDRLVVSDVWQALLTVLVVLITVPTAVAFIVWLQRAYLNLPSLGLAQPRFSSRWLVGAWFVPVLNLVWPKMMVDSAWRDSDPDGPDLVVVPDERGAVPLSVHLWWGSLLAMVGFWAVGEALVDDTLVDSTAVRLGYAFEVASSTAALVAAVLAFGLVGDVGRRQRRRAAGRGIDFSTGYRPEPTVVQPWVDQPMVDGFPPPPSVPPVSAAAADPTPWWPAPQ